MLTRLLIGLGNPGTAYSKTRHSIGFLVIDEIAKRLHLSFTHKRSCEALITE